ncbi:hypothetical protein LCGC14_3103740, partial [marine sediment metagenome]
TLMMSIGLNVMLGLVVVLVVWLNTEMAKTLNEAIELLIESRQTP